MTSFFKFTLTLFTILTSFFAFGQNTIGLIKHDVNTSEGYTLFSPESNHSVYLINSCGEKINQWSFGEKPGLTSYLLDNGNLLRAGKDSLQIRDWNNNIVWTYAMNANGLLQHHDIEPLPNGNILCVITDKFTDSLIIEEGRDSTNVSANFKMDKIVELQPVGTNDANIVWEWRFKDHLVQDYDSTKANFGVIANHPELIDINYNNGYDFDYTHVNSVDYNATLDQIIISPRHLNEILIIDHSTTMAQAAGHTGGNSGMGGDILWRWGNPLVYHQGTVSDQKLFFQHDAKWVQDGYADFGKISVLNNEGTSAGGVTHIHLIEPHFTNNVYQKDNGKFKPLDFDWSWNGVILGVPVYQSKKSGVQSVANGNMLICETSMGRISEITKTGEHVWTYINPAGETILNQFDTPSSNTIFRAENYPATFVGFTGKDLTPKGIIENQNDSSSLCAIGVSINKIEISNTNIVNPSTNGAIEFINPASFQTLILRDVNGKVVLQKSRFSGNQLPINVAPGLYFLQLINSESTQVLKVIVD